METAMTCAVYGMILGAVAMPRLLSCSAPETCPVIPDSEKHFPLHLGIILGFGSGFFIGDGIAAVREKYTAIKILSSKWHS